LRSAAARQTAEPSVAAGRTFCIRRGLMIAAMLCSQPGHEIIGHNEVSFERDIYKYVMEEYTPTVRPVRNDSETVTLQMDLYLNLLEDLVKHSASCISNKSVH